MEITHYMELNNTDVRLSIDVSPEMDGECCVDYEINNIHIVNRKKFRLSPYSKMFREIECLLRDDDYFKQTIEQASMDIQNDIAIDEALSSVIIGGVWQNIS